MYCGYTALDEHVEMPWLERSKTKYHECKNNYPYLNGYCFILASIFFLRFCHCLSSSTSPLDQVPLLPLFCSSTSKLSTLSWSLSSFWFISRSWSSETQTKILATEIWTDNTNTEVNTVTEVSLGCVSFGNTERVFFKKNNNNNLQDLLRENYKRNKLRTEHPTFDTSVCFIYITSGD